MDKKKTSWWQNHRPATRRLVQLYSALLYNAHLKGFVEGDIYQGKTKAVCVPGFNCYSCPGAVGACPLGAIQNALASADHQAGWYVLGIMLLYGVIFGRTVCGWLCPLGLIQELLHKIPTPKIKKSVITRTLSWLRYLIIGMFVAALPLWYALAHGIPLPAFCKYICPAGTFEGAIGLLANPENDGLFGMLGVLFTRKFVILMVIGLACVFCYRSFCRFLCPLGAIYGLFNKFNIIGVKVDENRCNQCGACVRSCGMDVRRVGDQACIHCGKCMEVCAQGAISIKAGKITLKAPEAGCAGDGPDVAKKRGNRGRVIWGTALAVLCFALLWYNVLDPSIQKETTIMQELVQAEIVSDTEEEQKPASIYESDAPIGYEVGNQLADFTVTCYDGSEFHLADTRGKITFINLWATYCTPCVQELAYFCDLYREHEGDITMLAVHSSLQINDPAEYVATKGWIIPFATDTSDDRIWKIVNGSATLPQTIVLNRKGEVIYNRVGSVTADVLAELYRQADEENAPSITQ